MTPELAFALPLTYAFADRFAGGGWPKLDARLPGRAAFWGAVLCGVVGWFAAGLFGALLAVAWLIWRTPAWDIVPGASMTPKTDREILATFVRHLSVVPFTALAAFWAGANLTLTIPFVGFAVAAAMLAAWYGDVERDAKRDGVPIGDENVFVETLRGGAFGVSAAGACVLAGFVL